MPRHCLKLGFSFNFLLSFSLLSLFNTVSGRLERKFSVNVNFAAATPCANCPVVFTVTISGANPAATGLTNAVTVDIGGGITSVLSSPSVTFSSSSSSTRTSSHTTSSIVASTSTNTSSVQSSTSSPQVTTATPTATATATATTATTSSSLSSTSSESVASPSPSPSQSTNLQTFTGALGNIPAPAVFDQGNGQFIVDEGNSSFDSKVDALERSW
jgi:hypothetical protein